MEKQSAQDSGRSKRMNQVIEISAEMFLKSGIDAIKMTDIAAACGVGVATLYRHFGTKTSITIAAMTHLWTRLRSMYEHVFETEVFLRQSGIKRLSDLLHMYLVLFDTHRDFMRLLSEFDLMLQSEDVPKAALYDYECSIVNFYPYVEAAFLAGGVDGTVRTDIDFRLFYLTYVHAMLALINKLLGGELLPSNHFAHGRAELELLADMAVSYLRSDAPAPAGT